MEIYYNGFIYPHSPALGPPAAFGDRRSEALVAPLPEAGRSGRFGVLARV